MKVLVVEENQDEFNRLQSLIEPFGHQVLWSNRGEFAWQAALAEQPEMIIINTMLPDIRGMELFYRIRTHPILRDMIVLLANPNPTQEEVFEGFSLYSDFHWQYPLDTTALTNVMRRLEQNEGDLSSRFQNFDFVGKWPNKYTKQG